MTDNFEKCLAFTLSAEGGYVENAADLGGPTNMGITLASLRQWEHGDPNIGAEQVRSLNRETVSAIYGACYWNPPRCDALPAGVDLMVFDFGVNAGPRRSIILLQHALGVGVDGFIGQKTLDAALNYEAAELVAELADLQIAYYRMLHSAVFEKGWTERSKAREVVALAMANAVNGRPNSERSRI